MADGLGAWIVRRRPKRPSRGLVPCPKCRRMNGYLQRGAGDRCAIGVGCNKGGGHVLGRAE